jgi:hypothetical protein
MDLGKLSPFVQKYAQKLPVHPSRKCRRYKSKGSSMKRYILLLGMLLLIGCASMLPKAGISKSYTHAGANVISPSEPDWYLMQHSQYGVVFAKKYSDSSETAIANTQIFPVGKFESDEAFFEVIKKGRSEVKNKERYKQIEAEHKVSLLNGHSCLKYHGVSEDHGSNGVDSTNFQFFKNFGYICRTKIDPTVALIMEVSHRSDSRIVPAELKTMGSQFFNSIELTK